MSEILVSEVISHFAGVPDPRRENRRHLWIDILVIAICAAICGADTWTDVELFGKAKEKWFKEFLALPHGIPSHDTFGRVFALIDAEQFQRCFRVWMEGVVERTQGEVVALDGKQLRRSHDKGAGKEAIYMVSAWASANGLVLGQRKVNDKSNEITAIPALLDVLDVSGCVVTTDAMGCQKAIVERVIANGADYVFAVKENQGRLLEAIQDLFDNEEEMKWVECDYTRTV